MIKNGIKIIFFCLGLFFLMIGLSPFFIPKTLARDTDTADILLRSIFYEEENTLDIIFIGDSVVNSAFIHLEIWKNHGISTYVNAVPKQLLNSTVRQLELTLKTQKPKVIVYEANNLFRVAGANYIKQVIKDTLPIVHYHNRWKPVLLSSDYDFDTVLGGKGYYYSTTVRPAKNEDSYKVYSDEVYDISTINRYYFKRLVDICEENSIQLIMVAAPTTVNWSYSKHNALVKLSQQYQIDFIDLNLEENLVIDWDKEKLDGGDYLNYFGAIKTTRYMSIYLAKLGVFTNKKNDIRYSKWNDLLYEVKYMKNIQKKK